MSKIDRVIDGVVKCVQKIGYVFGVIFGVMVLIGLAVTYHPVWWLVLAGVIAVTVYAVYSDKQAEKKKKEEWKRNSSQQWHYNTLSLREKADRARRNMHEMYDLLIQEKKKLEVLEQSKETMNADEYERQRRHLEWSIADREKYYRAAVEEFDRAEIEAP